MRPTIRLRLTLVYAGLFLVTAAVLIGVAYAFVLNSVDEPGALTGEVRRRIEALGPDRCRVRSHARIEVRWWALPVAGLFARPIRSQVVVFGSELRRRVERGAEAAA